MYMPILSACHSSLESTSSSSDFRAPTCEAIWGVPKANSQLMCVQVQANNVHARVYNVRTHATNAKEERWRHGTFGNYWALHGISASVVQDARRHNAPLLFEFLRAVGFGIDLLESIYVRGPETGLCSGTCFLTALPSCFHESWQLTICSHPDCCWYV